MKFIPPPTSRWHIPVHGGWTYLLGGAALSGFFTFIMAIYAIIWMVPRIGPAPSHFVRLVFLPLLSMVYGVALFGLPHFFVGMIEGSWVVHAKTQFHNRSVIIGSSLLMGIVLGGLATSMAVTFRFLLPYSPFSFEIFFQTLWEFRVFFLAESFYGAVLGAWLAYQWTQPSTFSPSHAQ